MKVKSIPSTWIATEGRRLDSGPFMGGALEAKMALERLACPKERLRDVTLNGIGGIVNAGRVKRLWVDDPQYGIPFLSSSDILQADLSYAPLIANRVVAEFPQLVIHQGWTLITRSGTIGRMVYARPDMDGMGCSEHVMRVIGNSERIPPGYLFAFLSSSYGVPMVVGGTYGSIIQSIEPHHIADLPIPRLGEEVESRVHLLIEEAAQARSHAVHLRTASQRVLTDLLGLQYHAKIVATGFFATSLSSRSLRRFDASYFNPASVEAAIRLVSTRHQHAAIGDVSSVFSTAIFKRIHVQDPRYGYPYYSGSELFQLAPTPRGYLSRKAPGIIDYMIGADWLLVQDAGQVGGLIGKHIRVPAQLDGCVVSNHLMRVVPSNRHEAGYLSAIFGSEVGYRAIVRHAFGSSIPQLDPAHIRAIRIPWPDESDRDCVASPMLEAWDLEDRATAAESEAVELVERTIAGATL